MKRYLKTITLAVICLLIAAVLITFSSLKNMLLSQSAADRWRGESKDRFTQISCFLAPGSGVDEQALADFGKTVDSKLVEASLEAPDNGSLWTDAYSAFGEIYVTGDKGSATVPAIGIGGDYFLFHPLELRFGSYIYGDDLMKDKVVLDVELAWKLFGAVDVDGMEVTIGGTPYIVAGVVERETDFASSRAYSDGAGIFVHYETLTSQSEAEISCYEIVMADPISGFAYDIATSSFPIGDGITVENTVRYDAGALLKIISDFGERSMRTLNVGLPYWENAARLVEDYCALLLVILFSLLIYPAIYVISLAVKLFRWIKGRLPGLKDRALTAIEDARENRRELRDRERETLSKRRVPDRPLLGTDEKIDIEEIIKEVQNEQKQTARKS